MVKSRCRLFVGLCLVGLSGCVSVPTPKNATLKTGDGPLVLSHRGGRYEYDDNAAGGFAKGIREGVRGFETDIRFTKDHELVVMHDGELKRTTSGTGSVERTALVEMKKLTLKKSGEPVPTAAEVMDALGKRDDVFIELEMKVGPGKGPNGFYTPEVLTDYCRKLNALAKERLAPGTYVFTCFNAGTLETMRAVDPDAPLGLIMGELTDEHLATAKRLRCCAVAPTLKTTKEMVDKAHAAGLTVTLWMVSNAKQYAEATQKGANRVTTDYPKRLLGDIGRAK